MAEDKKQNTNSGNTKVFNKGMVKDYTDIFISEGLWTHALNAVNNSHYGEIGSIGNEPSNTYCSEAPYDIIGYAHIPDTTQWVIFSTSNTDSEIGIFEQNTCEYTKVVNDKCLNFKKTNLITAVVKKNGDCSYSAYWQDGLNPDRTLNLQNVPYIKEPVSQDPCDGFVNTDILDCEKLRLQPTVLQPCVKIEKSKSPGQLNNGSYAAVIAYSQDGVKLTDYSLPSIPVSVWRNEGQGSSVEVVIDNLDTEFEEYELVIISVITQQAIAKKIGNYSTSQKRVVVDLISGSLPTIPIQVIPVRSAFYEKSDKIVEINNYLIRIGVTTNPFFNYQALANNILTKWVAVEYPVDYYWNAGTSLGYYRDEVYTFFIRWVYKTGARSASYHIPGRSPLSSDLINISSPDVLPGESQMWQVYDTSTIEPATGETEDGGVIIAKGRMAYHQSTELYPTESEIWGDLCNQPIRHHKMPSNETIHIHNQGGDKIIVLGVEFENIVHPIDSNGNPIEDIVGYEILRGSREGNRSIVAKGIFANMMEFDVKGLSNSTNNNVNIKGLMQNYPYNDLRPDPFLTNNFNILEPGSLSVTIGDQDAIGSSALAPRITAYKRNYLSFHSVETSFVRPSLGGNHIKIYTTEWGNSFGAFQIPHKHPKFKLLSEKAVVLSFGVGIGIALVASLGKTTIGPQGLEVEIAAAPNGVGTNTNSVSMASREGGPATAISDLINLSTIAGSAVLAGGTSTLQITGLLTGMISLATGVMFWLPQGMNSVLEMIYNMTNYRDYYLQYNSHGFYSNYSPVVNNFIPQGVLPSVRRAIDNNGAKYIGSGIQDFDNSYRINNLMRTKYVCLKTVGNIPDPGVIDNSKARVADVVNLPNITYKNPTGGQFSRTISSHYGAIKVDFQNQYGQLDSIVQIPTGSCVKSTEPLLGAFYKSDVIFGGDVYINRYTEKNPYFFFNSWLYDALDGTEHNYTRYVNGPAPRYFATFNKFDISDFQITFNWGLSGNPLVNITSASGYYRLDESSSSINAGILVRKNAWAYLFYNGVRDYFTESELNIAYRDYGEEEWEKHYDPYGLSFNDVNQIFRSDIINKPTFYKYDLSLSSSRLYYNLSKWGSLLPRDYNPKIYESCFQYFPNRVIYSLQHKVGPGVRRDFWRDYLINNFKDFRDKVNNIKTLNAQGAVVIFENSEPVQFIGVDQLQTEGATKITIGDGGLFQQNYQGVVNADDALSYGSSKAFRSAVNTPFGLFYISQNTGKILQYTGEGLQEPSRNGMKHWFAENLPSYLLEVYPNYPLYDNPVAGIGCQSIYDPTFEMLYFTKKDYVPLRNDLIFDDISGVPYYSCGELTPLPDTTILPEPTFEGPCDSCPDDYTFDEVLGLCIKEITYEASYSGPLVSIKKGRLNSTYNRFGIKLFNDISSLQKPIKGVGPNTAYEVRDFNGLGSILTPVSVVQSNLWGSTTSPCGPLTTIGRLNIAGVWVDDDDDTDFEDKPYGVDICYSYCLNVPEEKQYIIGISGDNEVKIYIDNVLWVELQARTSTNLPDNGNPQPFLYWYAFPVTLTAGKKTIRLCGRNHGMNGAFAAEIYDLSLTDIQTNGLLTPQSGSDCGAVASDIDPYIIFSTKDYIGDNIPDPEGTGEYSCRQGGVLSEETCGTPNCVEIKTVSPTFCLDCSLFSSAFNVEYGGSVTLFWTTQNAVSVVMNNGVGALPANGSITVNPTNNTTYYIVVTDDKGQTKVCSRQMTVNPGIIKCPCPYDDPKCFKPCDWTVSYDPKIQQWVSFHDWKPSLLMPSFRNFYSIKGNTIWKHNDRWDSYCNYYGQDYFWEVEYPDFTPNNTTVLRSLEYTLEVFNFYNDGRDFHHVLDQNFDRAIIYNTEQISGLLRLSIKGKNAPLDLIQAPVFNGTSIDILFSKEENKYRFNQFYDMTNDRGEFTDTREPMWITECDGYTKSINPAYINYFKPTLEQKRFRHYGNKIILRKNRSFNNKMVLKLANTKNTLSFR